jgi:hypothetical protein
LRKEKSRNISGSLSLVYPEPYRDFGVVSFLSGFAELLPEPVVLALELIALAWCRCL